MKDREFIELLNLYVDREISAEDALRLESEVVANPKRREVYDQYCRMQKACSMLSHDIVEAPQSAGGSNVVSFPAGRSWRLGPAALGLAAALACAAVIVTMKYRALDRDQAVATEAALAKSATLALASSHKSEADSMKPVFVVSRAPGSAAVRTDNVFAADAQSRIAELNWIGNIQMPPVFTASNQEFLLGGKADLKAAALSDPAAARDSQEPAEMTAFRFQR
jgi:hypothetical protein